VGGTKIAVVMARVGTDDEPFLEDRREVPTREYAGPEEAISAITEMARELVERHGQPVAAGVSCGGPLDSTRGLILSPPNLPGWDEVPITETLSSRLGLPVRLMNDADAGALAEHRFGAGRGTSNMIFLTFGTGIGAGLILNDRIYEGSTNAAGEIGHVRLSDWGPVGYGKAGSVEGFCSGGGISQLAETLLRQELQSGLRLSRLHDAADGGSPSAKEVFQAADAGDVLARSVVGHVATALGRGLAILVDLLNPELIALGGIYPRAEGALRTDLERSLRSEALRTSVDACRIVPAALGERIGDYAAVSAALAAAR